MNNVNQDIHNCRPWLLLQLSQDSQEDLVTLSSRLDTRTWPSSVLRTFTAGLSAELKADYTVALQCHQEVINCCSDRLAEPGDALGSLQRIIEESLVRMTQSFLALKDRQSACQTLGTLCEMLPQYMVSYARLLNLCGNHTSAIELLQLYLANFPQNWRASLLLAEIHEANGEPEKASRILASSATLRTAPTGQESIVIQRKNAA
jgi:tetratricopeptide (TPR) repeat protein